MKPLLSLTMCFALVALQLHAAETTSTAANAINALGIDLLAKTGKPDENAVLSPYSIQVSLAMLYAGVDGKTRAEMAKSLHFPKDGAALGSSFAALQKKLQTAVEDSDPSKKEPGAVHEKMTLVAVNRLYGRTGDAFLKPFLSQLKENYDTEPAFLDFEKSPEEARDEINIRVDEQTNRHIRELIPPGVLTNQTRLALVSAIYMKAAWDSEFRPDATKPMDFFVNGKEGRQVPTMLDWMFCGYAKRKGYSVVTMPYRGRDLQFVVLLPDDQKGLAALESKLTPALLAGCKKLEDAHVKLWMPKFDIEPPAMLLGGCLKELGMKSAFDEPHGSANFDRMLPRKPDDFPYLSEAIHQTFLSVDEIGTEAATATGGFISVFGTKNLKEKKPLEVEVHVDHPFLFAIQDRGSGACLFLGRVTEPVSQPPQITYPGLYQNR